MKFRSVFQNYRFVVLPDEVIRDTLGRQIQHMKGRFLMFGLDHMADTEAAQLAQGWTDEERLDVERRVMSHHYFKRPKTFDQGGDQGVQLGDATGFVLYFAPGQDVPPEHEEFIKTTQWYKVAQELERNAQGQAPVPTVRCSALLQTPDGDMPCPHWADPNSEYCAAHTPLPVEV